MALVVSPLQDLYFPIRKNPEYLAKLQQNSRESYMNLFYIPQTPPLPQEYLVDFSMVVSIPRSEFNFALTKKLLQMNNVSRIQFKLKLGGHFGRPTQEELDTNLYPRS